eukprot:765425-Hanusia_phi.AAC.4
MAQECRFFQQGKTRNSDTQEGAVSASRHGPPSCSIHDVVRWPHKLILAVCDKGPILQRAYGIIIEKLSPVTLAISLPKESSRCHVEAIGLANRLSIQHLLSGKFRMLKSSSVDIAQARVEWRDRRVMLATTGELVTIVDLQVHYEDIIVTVKCARGDDSKFSASQLHCWDSIDFPVATITVRHPTFASQEITKASLRHYLSGAGTIEAVDCSPSNPQKNFSRAIVSFDVSRDRHAAARAARLFHNMQITQSEQQNSPLKVGAVSIYTAVQIITDPENPSDLLAIDLSATNMLSAIALRAQLNREPRTEADVVPTDDPRRFRLKVRECDRNSLEGAIVLIKQLPPDNGRQSTVNLILMLLQFERILFAAHLEENAVASQHVQEEQDDNDADDGEADRLRKLDSEIKELEGLQSDADGRIYDQLFSKLWPRKRKQKMCQNYFKFELGTSSRPCPREFDCWFAHDILHGSTQDLQRILDLDVQLSKHLIGDLTLPSLFAALKLHRESMLKESMRIEASHRSAIQQAARLWQASIDTTTSARGMEEANCAAKTSEAHKQRLRELEQQLETFLEAKSSFQCQNPNSFRAARIFCREVYNRLPSALPIYAARERILEEVTQEQFGVLILVAETGSGKSTQVVQYLREGNFPGKILCTQPRQLACRTLSERVATELQTRTEIFLRDKPIEFLTDGALLNRLLHDCMLQSISAVVVDEVHERTVKTDLLLAVLRHTLHLRCVEGKRPFHIICTSATMNDALLASYFSRGLWDPSADDKGDEWAPVMHVGGRTFPVEVRYNNDNSGVNSSGDNVEEVIERKLPDIVKNLPKTNIDQNAHHDVLVFVTQADECERLSKRFAQKLPECLCLSLHGGQEREDQQLVFEQLDPSKYDRKIVFATTVAETSLTINGIGVVVDSGVSKSAVYHEAKEATVLRVGRISQSSARQRAGRAGRVAPGVVYRLYSFDEFQEMSRDQPAEMLRTEMSQAILVLLRQMASLKNWILDIRKFPFIEHPGEERIEKALRLLYFLGAISSMTEVKLTNRGEVMAQMSMNPRSAAVLLEAHEHRIAPLVSVLLGMSTTVPFLFKRPKRDDQDELRKRNDAIASLYTVAPVDLWGDIGYHAAVWVLASRMQGGLDAWCRQHFVRKRSFLECKGAIVSNLGELMRFMSPPTTEALDRQHYANMAKTALDDVTVEMLSDTALSRLAKMCMLKGYFLNAGFLAPVGKSHDAFYLPATSQLAYLNQGASLKSTNNIPGVCIYLELNEGYRLYINHVMPLQQFDIAWLPKQFVESNHFLPFQKAEARRAMFASPAVIQSACLPAFKRFVGFNGENLTRISEGYRTEAKALSDVELIMNADLTNAQIFIYSTDDAVKAMAERLCRQDLDRLSARIERSVREWALPGSTIRAVVGAGGEVTNLLFRQGQGSAIARRSPETICVRFDLNSTETSSARNAPSERLAAPITSISGIPHTYFRDIMQQPCSVTTESLAEFLGYKNIPEGSTVQRMAAEALLRPRSPWFTKAISALLLQDVGMSKKFETLLSPLYARTCDSASSQLLTVSFHGCKLTDKQADAYREKEFVVWPALTLCTVVEDRALLLMSQAEIDDDEEYVCFEIHSSQGILLEQNQLLCPAMSCFRVERVDRVEYSSSPYKRVVLIQETDLKLIPRKASLRQTPFSKALVLIEAESKNMFSALEDLFSELDPLSDVEIQSSEEGSKIWGRVWFSQCDLAAQACERLNGFVVAGNRELSIRPMPVNVDSCVLRSTVTVTVTSVPNKGMAEIICESSSAALEMLQKLSTQATMDAQTTFFRLRTNGTTVQVKVRINDRTPNRIFCSGIPNQLTEWKLVSELRRLLPREQLSNNCIFMPRSQELMVQEQVVLKNFSLQEQMLLLASVSSIAGDDIVDIQEIPLNARKLGIQFKLWSQAPQQAFNAAQRLDANVVEVNGRSFTLLAIPDVSGDFMFRDLKPDALLARLINEEVVRINSDLRPGASVTQHTQGDGLSFAIKGADVQAMLEANNRLALFQQGSLICLQMDIRSKLFMTKITPKIFQEAVRQLIERVSCEFEVSMQLIPSRSAVRLIGTDANRQLASHAVQDFIQMQKCRSEVIVSRQQKLHIEEVKQAGAEAECEVQVFLGDKSAKVVVFLGETFEQVNTAKIKSMAILKHQTSSELVCIICWEPCTLRLQTCGHVVCHTCGSQHASVTIMENNTPITCPESECKKRLLLEDLRNFVDDFAGLYKASIRAFVFAHPEEFANCSTPECPQIFRRCEDSVVTCDQCMRDQCPKCGQAPHKGESCKEAAERVASEGSVEHRACLCAQHIRNNLLQPFCPCCKVAFVDFEGCFALTCGNCHAGICGWCLGSTTDVHPTDPHQHVGKCEFRKKHFPESGHFFPGSGFFVRSAGLRLKQMIDNYLAKQDHEVSAMARQLIAADIEKSKFPVGR